MGLIVYGDFTCPGCYTASRQVDVLNAGGAAIDWRAVEHEPALVVTRRQVDATDRARLEAQIKSSQEALPSGWELPITTPAFVPRTDAAVAGYAEAYGAGVANDVRRLLFDAYWGQGMDIGDPEVLRRLLAGPIRRGRSTAEPLRQSGYAVGMNRGPMTTSAYRRIHEWRSEWEELGSPVGPAVVDAGRAVRHGQALRRLDKERAHLGVQELAADLPDPARYPAVTVRPAPGWVTQVGGPWALAHR